MGAPRGRRRARARLVAALAGCSVSDYVTVETAANEAVAELIQQRLAESGIPCVIVPSDIAAVAGAGAAYAVTVPPERADEARRLLGV